MQSGKKYTMASKAFPSVNTLKKRDAKVFKTMSNRANYPKIGPNPENLSVVYGGVNGAQIFMHLLTKDKLDWETVVRLVGSGVMSALWIKDVNILGSTGVVKTMPDVPESGDLTAQFDTGLEGAEKLTVGKAHELYGIEESEVGAFWGVLMRVFVSIPKEGESLDQFNDKRRQNATKAVMETPKIFIENSPYITWSVLRKVEAAFYNNPQARENLIKNIVTNMDKPRKGMSLSFYNMFEMLENSGMTAYAVVREAVNKGEEVLVQFPELYSEIEYVEAVLTRLEQIEDNMLGYIKLAAGERFVPANPAEFSALVGVCKIIVTKFRPSMEGYNTPGASDELIMKAKRLVNEVFGSDVPTPEESEE